VGEESDGSDSLRVATAELGQDVGQQLGASPGQAGKAASHCTLKGLTHW
jgi:hypothetical protein